MTRSGWRWSLCSSATGLCLKKEIKTVRSLTGKGFGDLIRKQGQINSNIIAAMVLKLHRSFLISLSRLNRLGGRWLATSTFIMFFAKTIDSRAPYYSRLRGKGRHCTVRRGPHKTAGRDMNRPLPHYYRSTNDSPQLGPLLGPLPMRRQTLTHY